MLPSSWTTPTPTDAWFELANITGVFLASLSPLEPCQAANNWTLQRRRRRCSITSRTMNITVNYESSLAHHLSFIVKTWRNNVQFESIYISHKNPAKANIVRRATPQYPLQVVINNNFRRLRPAHVETACYEGFKCDSYECRIHAFHMGPFLVQQFRQRAENCTFVPGGARQPECQLFMSLPMLSSADLFVIMILSPKIPSQNWLW